MKKIITFLFSLSVVFYLSGVANAQDKGTVHSQGPSVNQGHVSSSNGNLPAKGKSADQHSNQVKVEKTDKDHHQAWQERFQDRMQNNAALRARIESLLPAGTTFDTAASGFKNHGQFIAALHVSQNLNIPFAQLKATMLGLDPTTLQAQAGSNPKSLGQAIHELKPNIAESQIQVEVKKANKEAKETEKPENTTTVS